MDGVDGGSVRRVGGSCRCFCSSMYDYVVYLILALKKCLGVSGGIDLLVCTCNPPFTCLLLEVVQCYFLPLFVLLLPSAPFIGAYFVSAAPFCLPLGRMSSHFHVVLSICFCSHVLSPLLSGIDGLPLVYPQRTMC